MGKEAITAVNHWRGQCLDNFARAERAIIAAFEHAPISLLEKPPTLHETAAQRTRNLRNAINQNWPKAPIALRAVSRLQNWSLREKQRNSLVHGCFTVKGNGTDQWTLVNETVEIRKGVSVKSQTPLNKMEAQAFLQAIIAERKELEAALVELRSLEP